MATRNGRSTNSSASEDTTESTEAAAATPAAASDVARQQLVLSAQSMATFFRNVEQVRLAQQHLAQRAAVLHSQAAENLRKAETPMELVSIQGTLLMYQWQEGARFLQELMVAGAGMFREGAQTEADGASASPAFGAEPVTTTALGAAAPMVQAWQQLFTAAAGQQQGTLTPEPAAALGPALAGRLSPLG